MKLNIERFLSNLLVLRPIIVDCKDVAFSDHSNKQNFLLSRIKKVVDYFEKRNHQIYLIISQSRREQIIGANSAQKTPEQQILLEMEAKKQVHYTPSKRVGTKKIEQDEDHVKLQLAERNGMLNESAKKRLALYREFRLFCLFQAVLLFLITISRST